MSVVSLVTLHVNAALVVARGGVAAAAVVAVQGTERAQPMEDAGYCSSFFLLVILQLKINRSSSVN